MDQADAGKPALKTRFQRDDLTIRVTAFEAAPLIKPPALRGVSDCGVEPKHRPSCRQPQRLRIAAGSATRRLRSHLPRLNPALSASGELSSGACTRRRC
jgi:hypothetical protein